MCELASSPEEYEYLSLNFKQKRKYDTIYKEMYSTASSYSDLALKTFPHTTPPKIISNTKEIIKVLKEIIKELLEFIKTKIPEIRGSFKDRGEDG